MWRHFQCLLEANDRMNLTRITAPGEAAVKHYADSLAAIPFLEARLPPAVRVVDVGSGAGFPGFPIAAVRPGWAITCIDSTAKKARFLEAAARHVHLANVTVRQQRAREYAPEAPFDAVLLRAVAKLAGCLREARRLVRPGGWVICYKSASIDSDEQSEAEKQAPRLGYGPPTIARVRLTHGAETITRQLYAWPKRNNDPLKG